MGLKNQYFNLTRIFLFGGDVCLAGIAFYAAFQVRFMNMQQAFGEYGYLNTRAGVFILCVILSTYFCELYDTTRSMAWKEALLRIAVEIGIAFIILGVLYYSIPQIEVGRGVLALALGFFGVGQFLWRVAQDSWLQLPGLAKKVLILGTGSAANTIGNLIGSTNHQYVLAGYISCLSEPIPASVPFDCVVGEGSSVAEIAKREGAHKLVVSLTERRGSLPLKDVMACKFSGVEILEAPTFYEELTGKLLIEYTKPSWFIFSDGFKTTPIRRFIKNVFDRVISFVGLILLAPLMLPVALMIRFDSPGPVFFRQVRMGENEEEYTIYKFRTMVDNAEGDTGAVWAQQGDRRITRVGKILRMTRLDEVPQLFNVLRGEMSIVGPRPERPEFIHQLREVIPYYSQRHLVRPGITGWAQIRYPYGASVEDALEKLRYDLYYIKHQSLLFDLLIIMETVKVALMTKGSR